MKKSELTKLIRESYQEVLKEIEMKPDKFVDSDIEDDDDYEINDKKFKPNKQLESLQKKINDITDAIKSKFSDYKAGKIQQKEYIKFYKKNILNRNNLEQQLLNSI